MSNPFVLGLTGSIGMGKTTTAEMFREFGIPVWDADAVVHSLYRESSEALTKIGKIAPAAVEMGYVDRVVLQQEILKEPDMIRDIERIIHPMVARNREEFLEDNKGTNLVVLDIPLIFERGMEDLCDEILVVTINEKAQRMRVLARPGMTEEQLNYILSRQVPDEEKQARADHVIRTVSIDHVRAEVLKLIRNIELRDT